MNKELILKALNAYRSHKLQNLKNALKYDRTEIAIKTEFQIYEIDSEILNLIEDETN